VVERGADRLGFDLGPETLVRTALGELGAATASTSSGP
jgi:hypothetical protein